MDAHENLEKVGEGTDVKVYKANDKNIGQLFSLKNMRLECDDDGFPPTILCEISIL